MPPPGAGLAVIRASRLEALLGVLKDDLERHPPAHVLAPQTLVAAHPGMKQWLSGALARRHGVGGIAANLDIVLPSAWLERLAVDLLGRSVVALAPYQRTSLRWRIHALLPTLDDEQVRRYLAGQDPARRRFQLADRLARTYAQYMVYRPDWLATWAAGRRLPPSPDGQPRGDGLLAALWFALRKQVGVPHRGELVAQVLRALDKPRADFASGEPLHVFGVSHLAPVELAVLAAVARHRPVRLYVPDPCREYWLDQRPDREALREQVRLDPQGHAAESLFLGQGHPLLAAWGRMGQHFMLALEDVEAAVDIRDSLDEAEDDPAPRRLPRLQASIRRFDPSLLAPVGDLATQLADDSLRVHACHTRLRELEVLRDALLKARLDHPHVQPADIVVMAPDIQAYVPLLPAVFGEPGRHAGPLPYHIADVAVARSHSLFEAFRRLLDVPASRLTAPEVADWLAMPDVARRFNLAGGDVEVLVGWLRNGRVAWALDAAFRADVGVPAIDEHTFAWGMDRMLAGYVMGSVEAAALPGDVRLAPLAGIQGPPAALLGALDGLLVQLGRFHRAGREARHASDWAARLEAAYDALFRIDVRDGEARDAEALLRRFIRAVASEPRDAGLDPSLDFSVVRELLLERLDAAPERQRFLMGGVTFCGMVPQRAIPFEVVAVLGLNDGEFPRAGGDGGLDLMPTLRRLGDRDVRSDDRYLFLETVMSARTMLHLGFLGEGVRDGKPRNPAAPLAELLGALADAAWPVEGDADYEASKAWTELSPERQPWLVRHPLQPFDARYFDGAHPALFSFDARFAAMNSDGAGQAAARFYEGPEATTPTTTGGPDAAPVALREVLAYFKDPAKQLLAQGLNLRLDALDDERLRDREPLEAAFDALDQVARRVLLDALATPGASAPEQPPDWIRLGGLLPPGSVGDRAWEAERKKIDALLAAAPGFALFRHGLPRATPVRVDRELGGHRVQGELRRAYDVDDTRWVFDAFPGKTEDALTFREHVALFLEWALVRLDDPHGQRSVRVCLLVKPDPKSPGPGAWQASFDRWDDRFIQAVDEEDAAMQARMLADLEARVVGLLEFWREAQHAPPWYFPKSSWAAAVAVEEAGKAARAAWLGGWGMGERDYAPGYARLLAGEREFDDPRDVEALQAVADRLFALIDLPAWEASAA